MAGRLPSPAHPVLSTYPPDWSTAAGTSSRSPNKLLKASSKLSLSLREYSGKYSGCPRCTEGGQLGDLYAGGLVGSCTGGDSTERDRYLRDVNGSEEGGDNEERLYCCCSLKSIW